MDTLSSPSIRKHPDLAALFKDAEARHLSDDELETVLGVFPELAPEAQACREVREVEKKVVKRVVREIFSQYDYTEHHEHAMAKCPRDVRYVVAYATASMLFRDHSYFDDKVLIWLKTILQSFDFPKRKVSSSGALFADEKLEDALAQQPQKRQSVFHTYYRLREEMGKSISAESFQKLEPFLTQALTTLTEEY